MNNQYLSPEQQAVLDCIPAGHKEAISRRRLVEKSRLNERRVRKIIFSLIVKHGIPIGSCTGKDGGGYFIIQSHDDLTIAMMHLRPRAKKIFLRIRALENIARDKFSGQLKLVISE